MAPHHPKKEAKANEGGKPDESKPGTSKEGSKEDTLNPTLIQAKKIAAAIAEQLRDRDRVMNQEEAAAGRLSQKRAVSPPAKKAKRHDMSESEMSSLESDMDGDYSSDTSDDFEGFSSRDVAATEGAAPVDRPSTSGNILENLFRNGPSAGENAANANAEGPDLLGLVQQYLQQGNAQAGPAIDEQVVRLLIHVWENGDELKLDQDKLFARIPSPVNTPFIRVVELNQAVYVEAKKKNFVINRDIALKTIQKCLIKGSEALSILATTISEVLSDPDQWSNRRMCLNQLTDAFDCIAMANGKINMSRKFNLKACIDRMYHPILRKPGTKDGLLLGNQLLTDMKECEENEKLRAKAKAKRRFFKKKGQYGGKRMKHNGNSPFLIDDYSIIQEDDPLKGICWDSVHSELKIALESSSAENVCRVENEFGQKSQSKISQESELIQKVCEIVVQSNVGNVCDSDLNFANDNHPDSGDFCRSQIQSPGRTQPSPWQQPGSSTQCQQLSASVYQQPDHAAQVSYVNHLPEIQFRAEGIKHKLIEWQKITADAEILDMVTGVSIEFIQKPVQDYIPSQIKFSQWEKIAVDAEILKMHKKGVIETVSHSPGEYISTIFTRPKRDSEDLRAILNMKILNENIVYRHFKVDDLPHALTLLRTGYFLAVIDIKEGFHNVSVKPKFRKYLRFQYNGTLSVHMYAK